jgi:hypothetical protein
MDHANRSLMQHYEIPVLLQGGDAKTVTYLSYRGRGEHYSIVCVCSKVTLFLNVTKKLLCITKQSSFV